MDMAIKSKYSYDELIVIKDFSIDKPKTKRISGMLGKLNIRDKKVLLVTEKADANLKLAARNLANLELKSIGSLSPYDILNAEKVIFCESAINEFFRDKVT